MNSQQRPYPDHLYDPNRIAVGKIIIVNYLLKQMGHSTLLSAADLRRHVEASIDEMVAGLADHALRDLWNPVAAALDAELVPHLPTLTSVDFKWTRHDQLPVERLRFGTVLEPLRRYFDTAPTVLEFQEWLEDPNNGEAYQDLSDHVHYRAQGLLFSHMPPIIAHENTSGETLGVLDGNNRLLAAVIKGVQALPAYVGTIVNQHPEGRPFKTEGWVPTGTLMTILREHREVAKITSNPAGALGRASVALMDKVLYNTAAQYELVERATNYGDRSDTSVTRRILELLPPDKSGNLYAIYQNKLRGS